MGPDRCMLAEEHRGPSVRGWQRRDPRRRRYRRDMVPRKSREDATVNGAPWVWTVRGAAGATVVRRSCRWDRAGACWLKSTVGPRSEDGSVA